VPKVLVDTGFWFALLDRNDQHHAAAEQKAIRLLPLNIVIAWPVLYETLNTRFARNRPTMRHFRTILGNPGTDLLDDAGYREDALELAFNSSERERPLSLSDCVLRLILDDTTARIDFLVTFNIGDFADVCRKRGVQLLQACVRRLPISLNPRIIRITG
jgi:predicted nucleic acid-binding protein